LAIAVLGTLLCASPAAAQNDPNPGALTFTGSFDFANIYFFRGIRQETDPGATMFPAADLGIAFYEGSGGVKTAAVNIGIWNSLQTGTSGSGGITEKLHYEQDFYTTLNLGFGGGFGLGTTFTAYTSPNSMFATVKELSFKFTKAHMLNPYGLLAFELGGNDSGQADAGQNFGGSPGTYLELGVGPTWTLGGGKATVAVPVKVAFSLGDYYEILNDDGQIEDNGFGFFDIGGLVTYPFTGIPSKFGTWNIHGGLDMLFFGDDSTTGRLNVDKDGEQHSSQFIAFFGIGFTY
jgi:hypothetical protein